MNAGLAYTIESLFGPASNLIDITEFLNSGTDTINAVQDANAESISAEVVEECSVNEICGLLTDTWNNATLSAHLIKDHDRIVSALHSTASSKNSKSARKAHLPDPETVPAEVSSLQKNIDEVLLKSSRLDTESVLFMRTSKNSDYNILNNVRTASNSDVMAHTPEGIVIISVHERLSWGPSYVARSSQHGLLCSQTLQDLYDCIPCFSKRLPTECIADVTTGDRQGCVICIEGKAYGSQTEGEDYADKLALHLESISKKVTGTLSKAPTTMKDTKLSSLSVRINEPYWLIHAGNCEHFVLFNQIRLLHPSDHHSGYPMTFQCSPVLMDLCRACNKVPAIWSIVGDVRLGESPCVLCGPCWRNMGSSNDDGVLVVHIPEYQY